MKNSKKYLIKYRYIKKLLPKPDTTKGLNSKQELKLRSCIMMFHSEIEVFIEKLCFKILDNGLQTYKTKNIVLPKIAMLCLNCDQKSIKKLPTYKAINDVVKLHKSYVSDKNHGIKKEHLKNIFGPLGMVEVYDESLLPLDFYEDLNFLSKHRGIAVHSSMKTFSDTKIMPSDILSKMENINKNLEKLDEFIIKDLKS